MCVYLYARNSMIDVDDVFNRLSYINYSYQSIQTNKMVWVLFSCYKHKMALGYAIQSIMFMNIKDFVVTK